jgi:hypothetical protein
MTRPLHIATAALALGAIAAAALHTTPAEAFQSGVKAAGDGGSSVLTVGSRPGSFGNGPIPAGPGRNPGTFNPPGGFGNGGGKLTSQKLPGAFDPGKVPGGTGGRKLPPPSGSQKNNDFDPNQYRPPITARDGPTPFPTPTTTSQKNPNTFDPGKLPGGNGNIPPISGQSIPNPNLPSGNPGNGGGNGGNGGGSIPPIAGGSIPNPNLPWGNPGQGGGKNRPQGYGHLGGGYVEVVGDGYRPCWWLRRKFQMTGNVYWLNRFRHCLWRHYGD